MWLCVVCEEELSKDIEIGFYRVCHSHRGKAAELKEIFENLPANLKSARMKEIVARRGLSAYNQIRLHKYFGAVKTEYRPVYGQEAIFPQEYYDCPEPTTFLITFVRVSYGETNPPFYASDRVAADVKSLCEGRAFGIGSGPVVHVARSSCRNPAYCGGSQAEGSIIYCDLPIQF